MGFGGCVGIGGRGMKCTICGAATMPGAMLCRPCRAALKRARYVSVVDVPPSSVMQAHAARARRGASTGAGAAKADKERSGRPAPSPSPVRHAWVRSLLLGGGAIVALGTIAWFGQVRQPAASTAKAPAMVPRPAMPPLLTAPTPASATVNAAIDTTPATPASSATSARTIVNTEGAVAPHVARPAGATANVRRTESRAATARYAPPTAPNATNAMLSTGPGAEGFGLDAPPLPAVVVPAPRVVAAPPPPRDRWQTMGDERARCDREGGFSGFLCDQRVRITSCEGYWGSVPQCPLPPENPR